MVIIRGITVDEHPILISQYADDTSLIIDGSELSLRKTLDEFYFFAEIFVLK